MRRSSSTRRPRATGPPDLWSAYKLSSLASTGGATQTVAIVDAYDDPTAESDLATYRSTYGLSTLHDRERLLSQGESDWRHTPPAPDSGWAEEISLDLDMVSAVAPNAHILLVESNDSGFLFNMATASQRSGQLLEPRNLELLRG